MNKFREEYRRAVDELPKLHMDAGRVRDDLHHRRMQEKHRRMLAVKGCAAAAVFLFLGAGTAAARMIHLFVWISCFILRQSLSL